MLPGMELMGCTDLAVPAEVMQHVVQVESSYNPYAIGVVGGHLVRQPESLPEAVATARMLKSRGYNFSLGLVQVNRYNLAKYGLDTYEKAFSACPNLSAGSRILAECHKRSGGDWGKAFSCYYSGNFETGFRHGYVQKIYASMRASGTPQDAPAIEVVGQPSRRGAAVSRREASVRVEAALGSLVQRRGAVPAIKRQAVTQSQLQGAATPVLEMETASVALAQAQTLGATNTYPDSSAPEMAPSANGQGRDTAFVF